MTEKRKQGFLIMPFDKDLDWLHDEIMGASFAEEVTTRRADSIFKPGAILQQIFDEIDNADVIFAVCTGKNANVFFELGYAWREHSPILIASSSDDLPFDVASFRTAMYGGTSPGTDRHSLGFRLRQTIRAALSDEEVPRGKRRFSPPQMKPATRLSATLIDNGRGHNLSVSNTGTVELTNVDVILPEDVKSGFTVHDGDLPIDILRPGESVKLLASVTFGLSRRIFDITLRGYDADGAAHDFPVKISV